MEDPLGQLKRLVKLLTFIICALLFLWQCRGQIGDYLARKTVMSSSTVMSDGLIFPIVDILPTHELKLGSGGVSRSAAFF